MSDADRVARERVQAQRDALLERADQKQRKEASQRAGLLAEISSLAEAAFDAQKAAGYPALEMLEVRGSGDSERSGFKLAEFWIDDRGSPIAGSDYLLGDGTFASSYEGRALVLIDNWERVSVTRLQGIREGVKRLTTSDS
jgi:hypothetical protein